MINIQPPLPPHFLKKLGLLPVRRYHHRERSVEVLLHPSHFQHIRIDRTAAVVAVSSVKTVPVFYMNPDEPLSGSDADASTSLRGKAEETRREVKVSAHHFPGLCVSIELVVENLGHEGDRMA